MKDTDMDADQCNHRKQNAIGLKKVDMEAFQCKRALMRTYISFLWTGEGDMICRHPCPL